MTQREEKLSAFLDGELPEAEAREIEQALAGDLALRAELNALMAADDAAKVAFTAMLNELVPIELAASIQNAPAKRVSNSPDAPSKASWLTAAVASIALLVGGTVGYVGGVTQSAQVASTPGWLSDIADYHRVYAGQKRHLAEVGAEESDHIEAWLTKTVGTEVRIADLAEHGLSFQGARLLVAAGKPVAQLMYTDTNMRVVALCLIQTSLPQDGFTELAIDAFDMVSWSAGSANFVVIGDQGRADLIDIAQTAADQA